MIYYKKNKYYFKMYKNGKKVRISFEEYSRKMKLIGGTNSNEYNVDEKWESQDYSVFNTAKVLQTNSNQHNLYNNSPPPNDNDNDNDNDSDSDNEIFTNTTTGTLTAPQIRTRDLFYSYIKKKTRYVETIPLYFKMIIQNKELVNSLKDYVLILIDNKDVSVPQINRASRSNMPEPFRYNTRHGHQTDAVNHREVWINGMNHILYTVKRLKRLKNNHNSLNSPEGIMRSNIQSFKAIHVIETSRLDTYFIEKMELTRKLVSENVLIVGIPISGKSTAIGILKDLCKNQNLPQGNHFSVNGFTGAVNGHNGE